MQRVGLAVKVLDSACGSDTGVSFASRRGLSVFGCVCTRTCGPCIVHSAEKSGWVGGSDVAIWALGIRVCSDVH